MIKEKTGNKIRSKLHDNKPKVLKIGLKSKMDLRTFDFLVFGKYWSFKTSLVFGFSSMVETRDAEGRSKRSKNRSRVFQVLCKIRSL